MYQQAPWSNSQGTISGNKYWHNPTVGNGPHFQLKQKANSFEAEACLEVMRNAFSDATTQPRIPDGKAPESIGFRKKLMAEIEQIAHEEIEILFFAGVNACVLVRNGRFNASSEDKDLAQVKYMRLENHVRVRNDDTDLGEVSGQGTVTREAQINWDQEETNQLCKWRPVSYGLLLSLVNSSDDNEGWWEAVRLNICDTMSNFQTIVETDRSGDPKQVQPFIITPGMPTSMTSNQMLANQSYSTGKLRNISQIVFQLNPEIKDYDFNRIPDKIAFRPTAADVQDAQYNDMESGFQSKVFPVVSNGGANSPPFNAGYYSPEMSRDTLNGAVDPNYDAIYIKIHGVKGGTRRSNNRGSVLTALAVVNQELIYADTSSLVSFHKGPVMHSGIGALMHSGNMPAATVYNRQLVRSFKPGFVRGQGTTYKSGAYNGAYSSNRYRVVRSADKYHYTKAKAKTSRTKRRTATKSRTRKASSRTRTRRRR